MHCGKVMVFSLGLAEGVTLICHKTSEGQVKFGLFKCILCMHHCVFAVLVDFWFATLSSLCTCFWKSND